MAADDVIDHHQGTIEMANTELDQGTNSKAKELARNIIETQESEIDEMEDLLQQ